MNIEDKFSTSIPGNLERKGIFKKANSIFLVACLFLFMASQLCLVLAADDPSLLRYTYDPISPTRSNFASVGDAQTDLFTGAATYSYPLELPPGTNNLAPQLSLNYNSHTLLDSIGTVGGGWTISQNFINRAVNYTFNNQSDDYFELTLDGMSYVLDYSQEDARYHTHRETFFYIKNMSGGQNTNNQYWILIGKDGTTYRFGFYNLSESLSSIYNYTMRWSLDLVNDTYGNTVFYNYTENPYSRDSGAVYLTSIKYNRDGQREIDLSYSSSDESNRHDIYSNGDKISYARKLINIIVKTEGTFVGRYNLGYNTSNGLVLNLLSNITKFGSDNVSSLPSQKFQYFPLDKGWRAGSSDFSVCFSDGGDDIGYRLADINNDGLVDLLKNDRGSSSCIPSENSVYLNNGTGFSLSSSWILPLCFVSNTGKDLGLIVSDINNDGFSDLLSTKEGSGNSCTGDRVYLNNGTGWNANSSWKLPTCFVGYVSGDLGVRIVDVNNDGLLDILRGNKITSTCETYAYINNGTGWAQDDSWAPPVCFADTNEDNGYRTGDINGDGLPDIAGGREGGGGCGSYGKEVYINNGHGWTLEERNMALCFVDSGSDDNGYRFFDINGDKLADVAYGSGFSSCIRYAYINNGTGWVQDDPWAPPVCFLGSSSDLGHRLADINGDGVTDILGGTSGGDCLSYINKGYKAGLLKNASTNFGGAILVDYAKSTYLTNKGNDSLSDLGFNLWVVSNITRNNGIIGTQNITIISFYNRSGGLYSYKERTFKGFSLVTDQLSNKVTQHYFFQDEAKSGLEYLSQIYENGANLYKSAYSNWNSTKNGSYYVVTFSSSVESLYDGVANNPRNQSISYSYDSFGNVLSINFTGYTDFTGDERYETYSYVYNTTKWIVNKVKNYRLLNSNQATLLRETNYSYDGLSFGSSPLRGSLTKKEEMLFNGNNPITQYGYDSFGNIINVTDSNGHLTRQIYNLRDSTATFPDQTINSKGHVVNSFYDLGTGNVLSEIDSNGAITNYSYDIFGRKIKEVDTYDSVAYPTVEYNYTFDGIAPERIVIKKREQNGSSGTIDEYQFYDGFGKIAQTNREFDASQLIQTDSYYDDSGRIKKQTIPYLTSFNDNYTSPSSSINSTQYTYDILDRITRVDNPDRTLKNVSYYRGNITIYDENNNKKLYILNSLNKIVEVIEFNNGIGFKTLYSYDSAGILVSIKDARNNVFNYTYDSLGRKIKMIDPDLGSWNYTYDSIGNLLSQTDSRNVALTMQYDELNRKIKEISPLGNTTYLYDFGMNGTLSSVAGLYFTTNYTYDSRQRTIREERLIDSSSFVFTYKYDSLNRPVSKTLPNGESVNETYNSQGLLSSLRGIVNLSYNAKDDPVAIIYSNLLTTNYSYDPANFRVKQISTSTKQNLTYDYDSTGNVLQILDGVHNRSTLMRYDNLSRLIYTNLSDDSSSHIFFFVYNEIGNMLNKTLNGEPTGYQYLTGPVHAPTKIDFVNHPLNVSFISPTPINGSSQNSSSFSAALSTLYNATHYEFVDLDTKHSLWIRGDDKNVSGSYVDISRYNNTITTVGSVQNTTGAFGTALSFVNANSAGLRVANSPSLNVTDAFTVSFWMKGSDTRYNQFLLGKWDGTAGQIAWQVSLATGGICDGLDVYTSQDGGSVNRAYTRKCNQNYQDGNWHHVVGVFSAGQELSLYVDGSLGGSTTVGNIATMTGVYSNAHSLYIGNRSTGVYNGSIDEVLLFKRALTQSEVNSLYNAQSNRYVNTFTSLLAGSHTIQGFAVNASGNLTSTETRTISITAPYPSLQFVSPTPASGSVINVSQFVANLSSSDSGTHYAVTDFDRDIVLWVPFDAVNASESPMDISTYSSHGSSQGDANQSASGKFGKSFAFDGVGDGINVPDQASLDLNSSLSVSFWFKGNASTTQQPFVGKWNGTSGQIAWFTDLATGGACDGIDFYVSEDGGSTDRVYVRECNKRYQDNQWHHFAGTFDAGNSIKMYIDGSSVGSVQGNVSTVNSVYMNNLSLQIATGYTTAQYNGSIDDVLVFRRSLSQQEVSALYSAGSNQYVNTFSQVDDVTHALRGYAMNNYGVRNSTSLRTFKVLLPLDLYSLTYSTINNTKAISFWINNTLSVNVTNIAWNVTTGLTAKYSNFSKNITLKGGEAALVIIAYNYTTPGTYPLIATAYNANYKDVEGITVTV